ncbi:ABC transporter permease [Halomonas sp. GXIMD04776]|uniref:ABC transporter permease n=1 Tax=Halomonas sp. GXIMD04776 TaxID=3415605 RepID=UPI003CB2E043
MSVIIGPEPWYQPQYAIPLPGMMTGQILAGSPPALAVKYQMLIMFTITITITLGTGFGTLVAVAVAAGSRRLFDGRERLRLDRLAVLRQ